MSQELINKPPWQSMLSLEEWGLDQYARFEGDKSLGVMAKAWPLIISLVAGYLSMVFFVKPIRNPYWVVLKRVRQVWNSLLAFYSLLGSFHVLSHLVYSFLTRGIYATICVKDISFALGPTAFWIILFVLGKIMELGDTVLLLLSGKQVSFLHWFHHSTVLPWCWYEILQKTPMHTCCMAFNYTVHAVMYGYFALNDIFDDPSFKREWGRRITLIQCTQFTLDLIVIGIAACSKMMGYRVDVSVTSLCLSSFIITSYLILFLRFADEKYGWFSKIRHAVYRVVARQASGDVGDIAELPWHRPDLTKAQQFEEASKMAVMLSHVMTKEDLLTLYGTYKQAKCGNIPDLMKEPNEEKARLKWQAWTAVKDMTTEEAQSKYIETIDKLQQKSEEEQDDNVKTRSSINSNSSGNQYVLYPIKIVGTGTYVPKRVVYNEEIEKRGGFQFSAIDKSRAGVHERRFVDINGGENLVQNGAEAVRRACAAAGIVVEDIDLIVGGWGGHQFFPDDAALVQRELGLGESGVRAFTVHATCLSFLVGLDVAGAMMKGGRYKTVAVFASSIASLGVNPQDPHTAGLFGDGAAAVIIKPSDGDSAVHRVHMESFGIGSEVCCITGGGSFRPPGHPDHDPKMDKFKMDGEKTVSLISKYLRGVLGRGMPGLQRGLTGVSLPGYDKPIDIDWVIPHQASALGIEALGMFGWPQEKVLKTIHKYGNTISASIPLTLSENVENGKIKRGDKVLICGTSAGLSCAGMLLTY